MYLFYYLSACRVRFSPLPALHQPCTSAAMLGYDRSEQRIDKQRWIRDWISYTSDLDGKKLASQSASTSLQHKTRHVSELSPPDERPRKRVRIDPVEQLATPPPDSMSDASGSRKHARDVDVGMDD